MITEVPSPPEPSRSLADPHELLLDYLDFYREAVLRKLDGLAEEELRRSRLPSGWTPLELLKHLTYMERRWFVWGFAGEQVDSPRGDHGPDGRWQVAAGETVEAMKASFREQGARSREIAAAARLQDVARTGGRFSESDERPTLAWTLLHVLQEYARHAGHLDVVRELADGTVGE